jgi:hypothetical protein
MAGTYNGTDFGGASTWFESVTGRTDAQRQQAAANITAARERGVVVSADGERLWLALPSAVAFSPVAALSPAVPTRGPGAPSVGAAPTGGAGVPQVGSAPTKGPGAVVVRTARVAGAGVGNAVTGGIFGVGTGVPEKVTEVYIGGNKVPRDPKTSDAQEIEDAYGEAEFLSPGWFMNWGAFGANAWYGVEQNLRQNIQPVPKDIGVDRSYLSTTGSPAGYRNGRITGGGF